MHISYATRQIKSKKYMWHPTEYGVMILQKRKCVGHVGFSGVSLWIQLTFLQFSFYVCCCVKTDKTLVPFLPFQFYSVLLRSFGVKNLCFIVYVCSLLGLIKNSKFTVVHNMSNSWSGRRNIIWKREGNSYAK